MTGRWRYLRGGRGVLILLAALLMSANVVVSLLELLGRVNEQAADQLQIVAWSVFSIALGVVGLRAPRRWPRLVRTVRGLLLVACLFCIGTVTLALIGAGPAPRSYLTLLVLPLFIVSSLLQLADSTATTLPNWDQR